MTMSVDIMDQRTLWSLDTKKIFQDRLDFASPTKSEFKEVIPRHYTVLAPDRLRGSSSADSPCTSNGDLLTSRGSSSCSTGSSPISITKELTNIANPLTPLPHTPSSRSKSPPQDHAKIFLADVEKSRVADSTTKIHCRSHDKDRDRDMERDYPNNERRRERLRRSPVPSRSPPSRERRKKERRHRSRSSSPPRAKKFRVASPSRRNRARSRSPRRRSDKDRNFSIRYKYNFIYSFRVILHIFLFSQCMSAMPTNGKSEQCSSHDSLCNGTMYTERDNSQLRDIETKKELGNVNTMFYFGTKYVISNVAPEKKRDYPDSSLKDDRINSIKINKLPSTSQCISNGITSPIAPNTARTIIGPLLSCKEEIEKPNLSEEKRNALSELRYIFAFTDDPPSVKRKRLLSERGEKELVYPVMDKTTISIWNWKGCETIRGRIRGTGLVNTSNDCFLNVILQMVVHTAPLARYIWEKHPQEKSSTSEEGIQRSGSICAQLDTAIYEESVLLMIFILLYLIDVRALIHLEIFPSHIHGMQEDAHELLSLLLDAVDPPVGYNKQNGALPSGVSSKPSTPIEQIFGGTLRNQIDIISVVLLDVDLMKHMYDLESNQYVLTGVVEHLGAGVDHGHYISYARGFDSQSWYLFDDEIVSENVDNILAITHASILLFSRREHLGMAPKNSSVCVKGPNSSIRSIGVLKNNGTEQVNKSFTSMVNNGFNSQAKKFLSPTPSPYKKTSYRPSYI
uniref:Ubiquitin carboxyl-terminal hydrolase 36 n=1 Tax=Heterorhabditis bacteriophora TaxID=37862 RepID=A0A1I7WPV6_HETBA